MDKCMRLRVKMDGIGQNMEYKEISGKIGRN